jgi:hypothetical protein
VNAFRHLIGLVGDVDPLGFPAGADPFRFVGAKVKVRHGFRNLKLETIGVTGDRCYDFLNIFAEKFSEKIGVFDSKQSLNYAKI